MSAIHVPRDELIDYKVGDLLMCVVTEKEDFVGLTLDVGKEFTVVGVYINDDKKDSVRIMDDDDRYKESFLKTYINGSVGETLLVRKEFLTEIDMFEGKLAGWDI